MKCLRNPQTGEISRVSNDRAAALAKEGWRYVPKSVWKGWHTEPPPLPLGFGRIRSDSTIRGTKSGSLRRV